MAAERDERTSGSGKGDAVAIVVSHGDESTKLPARKFLQPPGTDEHLRPDLHLRPIGALPFPAKGEDLSVNRPPNASTSPAEHRPRLPLIQTHEARVIDDRRRYVDGIQ